MSKTTLRSGLVALLAGLAVLALPGLARLAGAATTLTITTHTLPGMMDGQRGYTAQLQATGGTPPYRWATNTPLPAGARLGPGGLLKASGVLDHFGFTAQVEDSSTPPQKATATVTVPFADTGNPAAHRWSAWITGPPGPVAMGTQAQGTLHVTEDGAPFTGQVELKPSLVGSGAWSYVASPAAGQVTGGTMPITVSAVARAQEALRVRVRLGVLAQQVVAGQGAGWVTVAGPQAPTLFEVVPPRIESEVANWSAGGLFWGRSTPARWRGNAAPPPTNPALGPYQSPTHASFNYLCPRALPCTISGGVWSVQASVPSGHPAFGVRAVGRICLRSRRGYPACSGTRVDWTHTGWNEVQLANSQMAIPLGMLLPTDPAVTLEPDTGGWARYVWTVTPPGMGGFQASTASMDYRGGAEMILAGVLREAVPPTTTTTITTPAPTHVSTPTHTAMATTPAPTHTTTTTAPVSTTPPATHAAKPKPATHTTGLPTLTLTAPAIATVGQRVPVVATLLTHAGKPIPGQTIGFAAGHVGSTGAITPATATTGPHGHARATVVSTAPDRVLVWATWNGVVAQARVRVSGSGDWWPLLLLLALLLALGWRIRARMRGARA